MSNTNLNDPRFSDESLFKRRSEEWTRYNIENAVKYAFSKINLVNGWKLKSVAWQAKDLKKREDLMGHKYDVLKVVINEYTRTGEVKKVHEYPMQIPKLLHDQYFYMGGFEKIPTFQLYDNPVIYRQKRDGIKILKFKNNLVSIGCLFTKDNSVKCNINLNQSIRLTKQIPIELLIVNMMNRNSFETFYKTLDSENNETLKTIFKNCSLLWTKTDLHLKSELGKYKINYIKTADPVKSVESIVFGLNLGCEMDFFTAKFMKTDSVLKEILLAISEGPRTDNDLEYKRIRFMEYIFSSFMKKVYDLICVLKYNKKIKIKITPTVILDECNVSSVVNHNFSYNPLDEITSLLKCSLVGPGSFNKDTVPLHMKNIHDSQMGRLCPVDTPDRDGCGVILNLTPSAKIDPDGKFLKSDESKIYCSMPITYVPFLKNNDQTRLQMSSSQQRQAINLVKNETPKIRTGSEDLYLKHSNFTRIAHSPGKVLHRDETLMVVLYDDGVIESYDIGYKKQHLDVADFIRTDFSEGDSVNEGDVLYYSNFIKDSGVCLGVNLLTGIAIWKGYNFEDGIVISKSASERLGSLHHLDLSFEINPGQILMSLKNDEYYPLPKVGECITTSSPYAKVKYTHSEILEHINLEARELYSTHDCIVTNVEVYPNTWNQQIPQFDDFIKSTILTQNKKITEIKEDLAAAGIDQNGIKRFLSDSGLSRIDTNSDKIGKYYEKTGKIKGVKVRVDAVYVSPMQVGDKLANRMGNKGVVSAILSDEQMPKTDDGRKLDIVLNPAGIISRINIGQLYELNMTESLNDLKNILHGFAKERSNDSRISTTLSEYCDMIDKTEDGWVKNRIIHEFKTNAKQLGIHEAINKITLIQPIFRSISVDDLFDIMKYTGSKFKRKIYDPVEKVWIDNPVAVGEMYFSKLVHRSAEKIFGRSIGPYVQSTLQPVSGKKNFGGHKLGEMEVWCLIAHGATKTLEELLTTHSDSPYKKNKMLAEILNNKFILKSFDEENTERMRRPRSSLLLDSYLKILGVNIKR